MQKAHLTEQALEEELMERCFCPYGDIPTPFMPLGRVIIFSPGALLSRQRNTTSFSKTEIENMNRYIVFMYLTSSASCGLKVTILQSIFIQGGIK